MAESLTPYINIADSMINSINIGGSSTPNLKASALQNNVENNVENDIVENDVVENDIVKNDIKQTNLLTEIRDTQVDSLKYVLETNSILKKQYQYDVDKERRDRAQQAELKKEMSKMGSGGFMTPMLPDDILGDGGDVPRLGGKKNALLSFLSPLLGGIGGLAGGFGISSLLQKFRAGGLGKGIEGFFGVGAKGGSTPMSIAGMKEAGVKGTIKNIGKGGLKNLLKMGTGKAGLLSTVLAVPSVIMSLNEVQDAKAREDMEGVAEAKDDIAGTVGGVGGALSGAALGAAAGSVVPVIGTAIGGIIGGILGGMGGDVLGRFINTSSEEKELKYKDRIELGQDVLKGRYKRWGTAYFEKAKNGNWKVYRKRDSWFGGVVADPDLIAYLEGKINELPDYGKQKIDGEKDVKIAEEDDKKMADSLQDNDVLTQSTTTYNATTSGNSTRTETITGSKEAIKQREKDLENAGKVFDTESGLIYDNIYNSANDFTQDGLKNMYKEHYVEALPKAEYLLNGNTKESKAFYKIWNEDEDKAIRMLSGMLNIHGSMYKADGKIKSTRGKMIATDKANLVYNMSADERQIEHISTNAVEDALKAAWSKGNKDKIKTDTTLDMESPDDIMTMGPMPTDTVDTDEPEQEKSFFETVKSIFGFGKKDKPDSQGPVNTEPVNTVNTEPVNTELGRLKETMGTDYSALDSLARTTLQQSGIENPTEFQVEKMRNTAEVENGKIKFGAYVVQGRVLTPSEQQEFIKLADPADPYNIKNAMSPEAQKLLNSFDPSNVNDISKNVVKKATALEGPEASPGQPIMMNNVSQPVNNNTTVSNTTKNYGNIETTQDSYVDKISHVY